MNKETLTPPAGEAAEILTFAFMGAPVRGLYLEGEPWFVGVDIACVLGYSEPCDAIGDHTRGVVRRYPLSTPGGVLEVRIIGEADVYRLITNSRMPKAREFGTWIDETVIPHICMGGVPEGIRRWWQWGRGGNAIGNPRAKGKVELETVKMEAAFRAAVNAGESPQELLEYLKFISVRLTDEQLRRVRRNA
jgi:prophage antirepressor-like protein